MKSSLDKSRIGQRVLVLGCTGSIGQAVAQALAKRGHFVTCLARSTQSERQLRNDNFNVLPGDIRQPSKWMQSVAGFDAVIHCAIAWADDMAQVDQQLVSSLLHSLCAQKSSKTFIYTGGCWAYGNTGNQIATEETPYSPLPDFLGH